MLQNGTAINSSLQPFNPLLFPPPGNLGLARHLQAFSNFNFPGPSSSRGRPASPKHRLAHQRFHPYAPVQLQALCGNNFPFPPLPPLPPLPPPQPPRPSSRCSIFAQPSTPPPRPQPQPIFKRPIRRRTESPEIILEKDLSKETVEGLLKAGKAHVILESGKRVRSEVWLYMGKVRLVDSGLQCRHVVACIGCKYVYGYKTKSQGTSTLRHHKCDYVHAVLKAKMEQDALRKIHEDRQQQLRLLQFPLLRNGDITIQRNGQITIRRNGVPVTLEAMCVLQSPDEPWCAKDSQGEGGRHQQRELTPEGDDGKPVMPTPPPLKEHIMNSPSPQSGHPVSLHQGPQMSGGMGGLASNGGRSNSSVGGCASPPPPSSKDSPPQQLLCVRWGNFDSNIVSMFSKLRSQEHFVDVTLWCEGKTIKCHKMILSACSMYFEKLLTEYPNPHPIIFLKDMRYWEIQALVEFMYRGEVSVHQEKLQSLLRAAESLQIKGLGSPSNEMGVPGGGDGQNAMEDDITNNTMDINSTKDMATNSSHNGSSHLHNNKDDIGSNSNSLHSHHLLGAANNNNTVNNHQASWQKFGLSATTNMMGIDLSNHGAASGALSLSSLHGGNLPLPLSLSAGSPQSGSGSQGSGCGQAAKRRKKETPRRIDLPRTAGMPLPQFNSTMSSDFDREEDDDAASEDSMAAHERNHVDGLKTEMQHDQYGDDEDCDPQENYDENDQGVHGEDEISDHGEEMEEDQDGALSLRVSSNLSDSDRERSRKGNPMKKILGIGNNNNNNEGGPQNLIHNVSSGGD